MVGQRGMDNLPAWFHLGDQPLRRKSPQQRVDPWLGAPNSKRRVVGAATRNAHSTRFANAAVYKARGRIKARYTAPALASVPVGRLHVFAFSIDFAEL